MESEGVNDMSIFDYVPQEEALPLLSVGVGSAWRSLRTACPDSLADCCTNKSSITDLCRLGDCPRIKENGGA